MTPSDAKARTEVDMSINVSSSERRRMTPSRPSGTLAIFFGLVLLFAALAGCAPPVSSGGEVVPPVDSGLVVTMPSDAALDAGKPIDIGSSAVDAAKPLPDVPATIDRPTPTSDRGFNTDRPTPTTDLGSPSPDRPAPSTCTPNTLGSVLGNAVARGTTTGRTPLLDTDGCGIPMGGTRGGTNAPEVVFVWEAPQAGTYVLDTAGSQFDTLLYVRAGGCQGLELACNDDVSTSPQNTSSRVFVTLAQGESVFVILDGFGTESGGYQLNINPVGSGVDGGAVDVFVPRDTPTACNAVDLGGRTGLNVVQGTTTGRSAVLDVSNCGAAPGSTRGGTLSPEAVYTWTAPSSDTYTFDTVGSAFDTILYLRQGDCTGIDLLCNDDIDTASNMVASRVRLLLSAGQRVTIVVDGYNGANGPFSLSITRGGGPADAGAPVCGTGEGFCAGRCVNTATDAANCGGCGVACVTGQRCSSGRCESSTPRWTIFVYGHGDHNLSSSLFFDLAEMSEANLGSSISVIVYADWNAARTHFDYQGDPRWSEVAPLPLGNPRWSEVMPVPLGTDGRFPLGTHLLRMNGGFRQATLLSSEPESNLDDPSVLTEAVRNAFTRFPADRYGVILWDHGGSWQSGFGGDSQNETMDGTGMSSAAVASALRSGIRLAGITSPRPLEFVAFDTCLMGAAEVAYPFRDLAQVYIGEAELDFGAGWDYRAAFNLLASNPGQSAQQFARSEMATWATHHAGSVGSADALIRSRVALDLTRMDSFATSARSFVTSLLDDPMMASPSIARAAMRSTPVYHPALMPRVGDDAYRDLGQFLDTVQTLPLSGTTRSAAQALSTSLNSLIISRSQGSLRDAAMQRGLQVALPEWVMFSNSLEGTYRVSASDWAVATRWSELVSGLRPGPVPAPSISATWGNTMGAGNSNRPSVLFYGFGELNRAQVRLFRLDPAAPDPGFPWQETGVLFAGNVEQTQGYRYVWDGMRTELPDGQPLVRLPFVNTSTVGMSANFQLEAAVGVCVPQGRPLYSCALVWDPASLTSVTAIDMSEPTAPSIRALSRITRSGLTAFAPTYLYESYDHRVAIRYGNAFLLPSDGRLVLRRSRAPAGSYEFSVQIRDVYGRDTANYQIVTTAAPYGP